MGIHLCPVDMHNQNSLRSIFLIPHWQLHVGEDFYSVLFKFMACKCFLWISMVGQQLYTS